MKIMFIVFIFIMFIFSGCNRTKSLVNPSGDTNKEATALTPSPTSNVSPDVQKIIVDEPLLVERERDYRALTSTL